MKGIVITAGILVILQEIIERGRRLEYRNQNNRSNRQNTESNLNREESLIVLN